MHPILFSIGPLTIYTYGVLLATAFFVGTSLAARDGKKQGMDPQDILDLCFYLLLSAIIGSRLLFVIVNYKVYVENPMKIFMIREGGFVFYGGLILATAVVAYFIKKKKMETWKTVDVLIPYIALGQAIGRWGCFFAGCCYGRPTTLPWAITFTSEISLAPTNVALHPTQVYSSLSNLTIFAILMFLKKRKSFDGQLLFSYGILYSVGRFLLEGFRGDIERGYVVESMLSTSQFISLILFSISLFMLFVLRARAKTALSK